MKQRLKITLLWFGIFMVGLAVGGTLFSNSQPRSFLALRHCDRCWSPTDILGLLASAGIQKWPGLIPSVVYETDKSIVVDYPFPHKAIHYVVFPKKDIKNLGDISTSDWDYVQDMMNVLGTIVREKKLVHYRILSNGPGHQAVTYLHFHLVST